MNERSLGQVIRIPSKALHMIRLTASAIHSCGKQKVFCIGKNKTGTTSLARALTELGFRVGEQALSARLLSDWAKRDFRRLILYCHTAQAFQDVPFSLPFTFQILDLKFPGSRFILSVRDDPEQWYHSLINFYSTVFSKGNAPTLDDLKAAAYVYPGWAYQAHELINNTPANDPFNKDILIANYSAHNHAVTDYFRHRPEDLLVLNVAEPGAYKKLCQFVGKPEIDKEFPWENKTAKGKGLS
jgi:hypothetical protein